MPVARSSRGGRGRRERLPRRSQASPGGDGTVRLALSLGVFAIAIGAGPVAIDDPPGGLIPTSTTLTRVHALYDRAHLARPARPLLVSEEWRLAQDDQAGTFRVRRLGRDRVETTTLGPLVYLNGVRSGVRWQQNRNGITFTFAGIHESRGEAATERPWPAGDVRLIGESVSLSAFVVELRGRREWLFVDKHTGVVTRDERVERGRRYTTTYDDFHTYDGIPEPSHVRSTDSYGNEREQTLLARTAELAPADVRDLDIPPSRRTLVEFPPGAPRVTIPVRSVNGLLIARVGVDGHAYDFLLDTGAAGIVVDPSVVEHLGLEKYGSRVSGSMGTFGESTTIVPSLTIGPLHLRQVVSRVVAVPFRVDDHTRIAGLLGFDFFADAVVHVDAERSTVEALLPGGWRAPADSASLSLALDDKTPTVRSRIGNSTARVVLDTGANRTVIEQHYAERADLTPERGTTSGFRVIGGRGYAESLHLRSFELAGVGLGETTIAVSPADVAGDDVDGVVGTDVLRAYDLWFDYRTQAVWVRRGRRSG